MGLPQHRGGSGHKDKIAALKQEMARLEGLEAEMVAAPDQQISLSDPDARSMATSGRGSGIHQRDNVVPLLDAIVAYRNRLIKREQQSNTDEFKSTSEQIERWLVEFAYQRVTKEY